MTTTKMLVPAVAARSLAIAYAEFRFHAMRLGGLNHATERREEVAKECRTWAHRLEELQKETGITLITVTTLREYM